jgi:hypothetical protein
MERLSSRLDKLKSSAAVAAAASDAAVAVGDPSRGGGGGGGNLGEPRVGDNPEAERWEALGRTPALVAIPADAAARAAAS